MKEKIKELRIKIDGLAQLVEHLHPQRSFKIDIAQIPEGWDLEKFITYFKESGYAITDSRQHKLVSRAIQEIPQQFKEVEKAKDSLYLAKAWLGKILQELGEQTPYQNDGKRKEVEHIENAVDTSKIEKLNDYGSVSVGNYLLLPNWGKMKHVEKVDSLREMIKDVIQEISKKYRNVPTPIKEVGIAGTICYTHLSEARFWLGFELERIKKQDESRKESSSN